MQNKADVKSIMARLQASGMSTDETSSTPAGRPKQPLHSTLSSGPPVQTKKPVLESLSGSAIIVPPKPNILKNTVSTKSDTDAHEPSKMKSLTSRFSNSQEDTNTNCRPFINKQQIPPKPTLSQAPEAKGPGQKPPLNKPPLSSTLSDSKPAFPKPPPAVTSKPSWVKEDTGGGETGSTPPKIPPSQQKPSSSILKLRHQNEEMAAANTDLTNKPVLLANSTVKPTSNFKMAQNMFNKEMGRTEQSDSGSARVEGASKPTLTASNSIRPPKPLTSKRPSVKMPSPQDSSVNGDATPGPRRNPLPNSLALGAAPAKPNRPPRVNLEQFKRRADASDDGPGTLKKPVIPPPISHPGNHSNNMSPTQPPQTALPSLPPRHPGTMIQQEDFYDDIDELSSSVPPLPPSTGHPSQRAKAQEDAADDDGEMYEDLDERWEAAGQKQDKVKEEKKRLEAEKKEQKEREKKEQDARKKFKLVGPLEAVHQVKACVDCKGSKTDLALKQGECLDIIRVQGNPEGKWLGRTQDGSIGYVKTTSVEIDFNTLKKCKAQQQYEPEVYDDIDVASPDNSGIKGPGVVLPPLPGEEGEIYDDVVDPNLEVSALEPRPSLTKPLGFLRMFDRNRRTASTKVVPPPSQFTAEGNQSDQPGAAIDEEIYDDVDSQSLPPPPPLSSLPALKAKGRTEEMDPKKQRKIEKEEKEFRKKFKYEGEIQVLYQVTIAPTLTNKKWTGKELAVKAGEKVDVIVKAVDGKLICRNEEGKFGFVSTCHTVMDDGEIYDDIGDGCIYDND